MIAETGSINIHVFVLIYYTYLLIKDRIVNICFLSFIRMQLRIYLTSDK
jgi:hypothetical protein